MKSTIIAASFALAATMGMSGLAQAAGVTMTTNTHPMHHAVVAKHHHCVTKVTKVHFHHRIIVKHQRVCR